MPGDNASNINNMKIPLHSIVIDVAVRLSRDRSTKELIKWLSLNICNNCLHTYVNEGRGISFHDSYEMVGHDLTIMGMRIHQCEPERCYRCNGVSV